MNIKEAVLILEMEGSYLLFQEHDGIFGYLGRSQTGPNQKIVETFIQGLHLKKVIGFPDDAIVGLYEKE